jgi:hypothetical protein
MEEESELGLRTNIAELKRIIIDYKVQLRRMKINDINEYPLIINISNNSGEVDAFEFKDYSR